jgi:hypothetical protein
MVRIFVTEEAFEAIKGTMPAGSVAFEPEVTKGLPDLGGARRCRQARPLARTGRVVQPRDLAIGGGGGAMTRAIIWALIALAGAAAVAQTPSLTCQDTCNMRHCWNERGETVITEQRSPGGYTHSRTADGKAFTTWDHNGLSHTWPTSPTR